MVRYNGKVNRESRSNSIKAECFNYDLSESTRMSRHMRLIDRLDLNMLICIEVCTIALSYNDLPFVSALSQAFG